MVGVDLCPRWKWRDGDGDGDVLATRAQQAISSERERMFWANVCPAVVSLQTLRYARLTMKPLSKIKKHFSSRLPFVLVVEYSFCHPAPLWPSKLPLVVSLRCLLM